MIQESIIRQMVAPLLDHTPYELMTVTISKDNDILIEIDQPGAVDIDFCAELNRRLVAELDSNPLTKNEDYSLEVGSVSLTAPFLSRMQYEKHLGHNVVVTDRDGKRHSGQLVSVDEDTFMIDTDQTLTFRYDEVKQTVYNITF
ncbi:MAG: hypothetical protein IJ838_05970 [Paludibacteraceae bacterium]|nr:hypothetical protein [Paludibacteraceae bacterium]